MLWTYLSFYRGTWPEKTCAPWRRFSKRSWVRGRKRPKQQFYRNQTTEEPITRRAEAYGERACVPCVLCTADWAPCAVSAQCWCPDEVLNQRETKEQDTGCAVWEDRLCRRSSHCIFVNLCCHFVALMCHLPVSVTVYDMRIHLL